MTIPSIPAQEPIAYLYHDAASAAQADPLLHSTLLVMARDRRPNCRNEMPLYAATTQAAPAEPTVAEAVAAERERCARLCEPTGPRPCDCERCDCGNATDARMVAEWDEATSIARRIRGGEQAAPVAKLVEALRRILEVPGNTMSDGKALKEIVRIARAAIACHQEIKS